MTEPLYRDGQLKIDYHPTSTEDHLVYIRERSGEEMNYLLPRGTLEELARTPRGQIRRMGWNEDLLYAVEKEGIGIDGLHVAVCQAYQEQEKRIERFRRKKFLGRE